MRNTDFLPRLRDPSSPPLVMGVLNITPDSFSDGGAYIEPVVAVAQAQRMIEEGAQIIDIGGESTRPGAATVAVEIQRQRVLPVISALRSVTPASTQISIDTRSPEVAVAALEAGADIVNDVSAGADPSMLEIVAARRALIILMHMQGTPATMQHAPNYGDVTAEVIAYLQRRVEAALKAGVEPAQIVLDPGIGFGKNREHNLTLLRDLPRLVALGFPVLLGTSRKRFMGAICRETAPQELVGATCATTALGVEAGVRIFRVHDVKPNRQALEVAWALRAKSRPV